MSGKTDVPLPKARLRTIPQERCPGDRDQASARPEREEASPVYPARAIRDRQAPAQSDQWGGSCRGLDLVASCSQFYTKATSPALLIVDDQRMRSAFR